MSSGERCLLVHGHFYQPPRENPWTGRIEPQHSADPWENWNSRIADECYIPMARSKVHDRHGKIADLYNNYAHTSFNFGPTLMSWLAATHPSLIRHLRDAATIDNTFAMAQAYNHLMLPLADARDRHTQILWGLREFHHRFGYYPKGMWLSECGIDRETVRALVDHGVKFTILSPHQASRARPFGESDWRDVSMGAIDTRRAYRLFEIDGGGRTHFNRFLDIVFYTPGLNLKVSFDHILNRPDDLARELDACYSRATGEAQLVSIVTDGEIYGHHEKKGEQALSRLFREIAPSLGLRVCSAGEFVRDHPPTWEVKLWNGEDGNGSSWSCQHGMGRWSHDCGCRPPSPPGWNQAWRAPLRSAFDLLRDKVRETARRELGALVWDADEAHNDYISIILDPSPAARRLFLRRHAQRQLELSEVEKLWRMLEARHHAMLMYASCGWFFDELSGLEPVQNMRYALRAAELVQPYADEDLAALLERELEKAPSNLPRFADGGAVFRELVLPSRHTNRELAAAVSVCLTVGLPTDSLGWKIIDKIETVNYDDSLGNSLSWGSFVCHDEKLDRFIKSSWLGRLDELENSLLGLYGYEEVQGDPYRQDGECPLSPNTDFSWLRDLAKLKRQEVRSKVDEYGIANERLPMAVKEMLYRKFYGAREDIILREAASLGTRSVPFLSGARKQHGVVPDTIVRLATNAFGQEIEQAVLAAIADSRYDDAGVAAVERSKSAAAELGLWPDLDTVSRYLHRTAREYLYWMGRSADREWLENMAVIQLPSGEEWVSPAAPGNRTLRYPDAGPLSTALGKGLAKARAMLLAERGIRSASLLEIPLPELLAFARRCGMPEQANPALGIDYWDFLGTPLSMLVADDPVGIMTGEAGDRVKRIGLDLGYAEETLEKRILETTKGTARREVPAP